MQLSVNRKPVKVHPDFRRVVARFFFNGPERAKSIIHHVMKMPPEEVDYYFKQLLREFSRRHRNVTRIFALNFDRVKSYFHELGISYQELEVQRRLLIGSYFTMEYAIEAAAFFNPSMVEDVDQSGLPEGQKRVILSFRAVGEGHISSIVFRRAIIDANNNICIQKASYYIDEPE